MKIYYLMKYRIVFIDETILLMKYRIVLIDEIILLMKYRIVFIDIELYLSMKIYYYEV